VLWPRRPLELHRTGYKAELGEACADGARKGVG
jgi:hypothetical protein